MREASRADQECPEWMEFTGKMEPPDSQGSRVSLQQLASRENQDCPGPRGLMVYEETRDLRAVQERENEASQEKKASRASQDVLDYLGH